MRRLMTLAERRTEEAVRPTLELTLEKERRRSFEVPEGVGAEAVGVTGVDALVASLENLEGGRERFVD